MIRPHRRRVAAAAGAMVAAGALWVPAVAGADTGGPAGPLGFAAAAQAPVMQITEDEPSANFHPEGEGNFDYSLATLNPSNGHALSSVLWPGGAAGNAGTLVAVLGGPSQASALNDPVRAEAISGTSQTDQSVSAPTGTTMTASVKPDASGDQESQATTNVAGGDLGPAGSVGVTTSSSRIVSSAAGTVTAAARSTASKVDLGGGVFSAGSVVSSASGTSAGGAKPSFTGQTVFSDLTIAGHEAYVDGTGVHVGSPGRPASSAVQDAVNQALTGAGMEIFFTYPYRVTVGGVSYFYAASVLVYWAPPGDSKDNSFTVSLGGAAVSMDVTPGGGGDLSGLVTGVTGAGGGTADSGSGGAATAAPATLALPSDGAAVAPPAALGHPVRGAGTLVGRPQLALSGRVTPTGLGGGWLALVLLAALAGAAGLSRLPALLSAAATANGCPRERPRPGARR